MCGPNEYPANLMEFIDWFPSDAECLQYLEAVRWPNGFGCPRCGAKQFWPVGEKALKECARCHHQTSVTAGTIFDRTRKSLRMWFFAMWLITGEKNGINARWLQRELGFSRYETAWTWLHKLRRAMVRPGLDRLSGTVEVGQITVGGDADGDPGRELEKSCTVLAAVEVKPQGTGHIRLQRVSCVSGDNFGAFLRGSVDPEATIRTSLWNGGKNVADQSGAGDSWGGEPSACVRRVGAHLERWLERKHHGPMSDKHVDYYLDEFTFRFNCGESCARGELFLRLVQQAVRMDGVRGTNTVSDQQEQPE